MSKSFVCYDVDFTSPGRDTHIYGSCAFFHQIKPVVKEVMLSPSGGFSRGQIVPVIFNFHRGLDLLIGRNREFQYE
jgi:hypothetical protein